jgi:hypothetical protein
MSYKTAGFHCKNEISGGKSPPVFERLFQRKMIKRTVDLNGIQVLKIEFKHLRVRNIRRVKRSLPVSVAPAGRAYADLSLPFHLKNLSPDYQRAN